MRQAVLAALAAVVTIVPACADQLPGKAVFDKTCKNCHGPEGKGNPTASSFWKVKIPRLDTQYVQQKSEDE